MSQPASASAGRQESSAGHTTAGRADAVTVPVDQLKVGVECRSALVDETGVLLLGAGTKITQEVIQGLRDRGIEELAIQASDLQRMQRSTPNPRAVRRPVSRPSSTDTRTDPSDWAPGVPLKSTMVDRFHEPLLPERSARLKNYVSDAHADFESLRMELATTKLHTVEALNNLSAAFAAVMVDDHDQTVGEVVQPSDAHALTDRCVKLGVLGMAVGAEMDLDGPGILELGTTGLLHDIGLYTTDSELSSPGRQPFTDQQLWEFRKHPVLSANCLREVSDLPKSVLLAIEQVHEQYDGSGYPFGLEGKRIHLYARILNVCDTYLQLTIGTSFRKPLLPHDALGLILHQARYGLFDPKVIHALLRAESLFPLGSRVELSNGQLADVIRRPNEGYANPVLQSLDGLRLDLDGAGLEITRPVANDGLDQIRLGVEEMQALRWNPADDLFLRGLDARATVKVG